MASYKLKYISFFRREAQIVMQNENGPCPLLAIVNVLLLRNAITLSEAVEVKEDKLLETLANFLIDFNPVDPKFPHAADLQKNLDDVMTTMHKLTTGIDVNPKFRSVKGFEFTNEVAIFDLFNINLVHGWLIDPQERDVSEAIGDLTYNQVVSKLISRLGSSSFKGKCLVAEQPPLIDLGGPSNAVPVNDNKKEIWCELNITHGDQVELKLRTEKQDEDNCHSIQFWLDSHSSQLTPHGLTELHKHLANNELAVFFRNNHFSTIFKNAGFLYILVTDQGYLPEDSVVWEELGSVNNDNKFYNGEFVAYDPTKRERVAAANDPELDYALAMSLSMQDSVPTGNRTTTGALPAHFLEPAPVQPVGVNYEADLAYARQIQEQENLQQERERQMARYYNQSLNGRGQIASSPQQPRRAVPTANDSSGSTAVEENHNARSTGGFFAKVKNMLRWNS
eukprot:g3523.t1